MDHECYQREPLRLQDGIPVFSAHDEYVENYTQIAQAHLNVLRREGVNPWIQEDLWVETEECTRQLIRKYAVPGQRILDVGVGLGRLIGPLKEYERHGMDISLDYLAKARENGIQVCMARIEDMPYHAEFFDLVVCTDVLEHVLNLHLACERILSVLKPGGILVVRVPNHEDMAQYVLPDMPYKYIHLRRFDQYDLQLLWTRCFDGHLLELVSSGVWPLVDRLKTDWVPRRALRPVLFALNLLKKVSTKAHRKWVGRLFHPYVMNIVVQKKTSQPVASPS